MIRVSGRIILLVCLIQALTRCAQITPLTGGARDITPPKLLTSFPEMKSTAFNGEEITLQFDEYVQVRDIQNQVIISPTVKNNPEVESIGKKIKIKLRRADLLPNTTYRITFGKAIADMHEGNILENLEYIFSTGAALDTLSINGNIRNAFNHQTEANVNVGLIRADASDSSIYKQMPLYISKTDASGNYALRYVAKGNYKLIAIDDKNKNGFYDGEAERVGFYKETLQLISDTNVNVDLFQEEVGRTYLKKSSSPEYGQALLVFSKSINASALKVLNTTLLTNVFIPAAINDSLFVFYKNISDSLWLELKTEKGLDSIKLNLPKQKWKNAKRLTLKPNISNGVLRVGQSLEIETNQWIDSTKTQIKRIRLLHQNDSSVEAVKLRYLLPNKFVVDNAFKEGVNYTLKIDSSSMKDYADNYNDSLVLNFKRQPKTELGHLILKTTFTTKNRHIVQLLNESQMVVKEVVITPALAETNVKSLDFTDVPAGQYTVKIIFDTNENNKWDTGHFIKHQQAENIKILDKRIKVMSDWDVEEEIFVKE